MEEQQEANNNIDAKDGRPPIDDIYKQFSLLKDHGFKEEVIYNQINNGRELPILAYKTDKEGPALILIFAVHGDEPAGIIAGLKELETIIALAEQGIPIAILICNPKAYENNWHYPKSSTLDGPSVGDCDHLIPDKNNPSQPHFSSPTIPEAAHLSAYTLKLTETHNPLLVIDFHEDNDPTGEKPYIYSQGKLGFNDPIAKNVLTKLKVHELQYQDNGDCFGIPVVNGITGQVKDYSIDHLFAAPKVFIKGKPTSRTPAKSVITVETPTIDPNKKVVPLEKRVNAQRAVIRSLGEYWQMINDEKLYPKD